MTKIAKQITYADKVRKLPADNPDHGTTDTFRAIDANEIKEVVNDTAVNAADAYNMCIDLYQGMNPVKAMLTQSLKSPLEVGYAGTATNNLSWNYKEGTKTVAVDSQTLTCGSVVISSDPAARSASYTFDVPRTPTTLTFKIAGVFTAHGTQTPEASVSLQFVCPSYFGVVSNDDPSEATVKTLTNDIRSAKDRTCSGISLNNNYYCFAYPASFGALTSIKDANDFQYINSFTCRQVNFTIQGVATSYYVYTLTTAATASGVSYIFA